MSNSVHVPTVNIDEKCFVNYSGPSTQFNQYNILFGLNGHGKSTLAKYVHSTALSNGVPDENIRIYNAKYIEDTLLLKQGGGKINSVKANFGTDNTDIEKQVAELEKEIADIEKELIGSGAAKGLFVQSQDCLSDMQSEIRSIHSVNKGKTTIKLKFSSANPFELKTIESYENDYSQGLKKFSADVIKVSSGNDDHEADLVRMSAIKVHSIEEVSKLNAANLKEAIGILAKTYEGTTPGSDELDWLIAGAELHTQEDSCKFCLSKVDIVEVKKRIEAYKADSKVADMSRLKNVKEFLSGYIRCADNLLSSKESYAELYDDSLAYESDFEQLEGCKIVVEEFHAEITKKIKDDSYVSELSEEYYYTVVCMVEGMCEELDALKQNVSSKITELINLQNMLVRARIGHDITSSEIVIEKKAEYEKLSKLVVEKNKAIKTKEVEIKALRMRKSEIANFSSYVNGVLKSLGFDFELVPDTSDMSYTLKHINDAGITIDEISEGERNLLALLYFYFEMLDGDEKSIKSNIKLIIIDDPIASLDEDNRFYILETIKTLLDGQIAQVFVFTHLWSNFCDLSYGKNGNADTNLYEIMKTNSRSDILPSAAQEHPYKRLYAKIWDFSQTSLSDVDDDAFLHMPNTIRRVLEDYMRFYAGVKVATSNSKEQISKGLLGEEYAGMSNNKKLGLTTLLSVANILSHRIPDSPSKKEIHDSAKFLMNKMKEKHQPHHDAMKTLNR